MLPIPPSKKIENIHLQKLMSNKKQIQRTIKITVLVKIGQGYELLFSSLTSHGVKKLNVNMFSKTFVIVLGR